MRKIWRRYIGFAKCSIETKISYRSGAITNIFSQSTQILFFIFFWSVLFQHNRYIQGYDRNQMIIYILISATINATLSFGVEDLISRKIRDGSIAEDLIKPINFQCMIFFQTIGKVIVEGAISFILTSLFVVIFVDISEYLIIKNIIIFGVSVLFAFMIKFCLAFLGGVLCFYTTNNYGILLLRQVMSDIFGGGMLPLKFFPVWFQEFAKWLPFQASLYLPSQIFLGKISNNKIFIALLIQIIWIVVLWLIARKFFVIAVRKITIQGG